MRMAPRALSLAETTLREAPPGMREAWTEWAGGREPGTLPPRDAEGYVEVPDPVARIFLDVLEAEIDRIRPAPNEALLPKAVAAVLRQGLGVPGRGTGETAA